MTNSFIVTLKGVMNSSIDILMDKMAQVGEKVSFESMPQIVPKTYESYTNFFYRCIDFCTINGSRLFNIDKIFQNDDSVELQVSPVKMLSSK